MPNLTFSTFDFATPAFDEALSLRTDILRKPLNMEFYVEDIEKEFDQTHMGAYLPNGVLVACLSLAKYDTDKEFLKMRQVATREDLQGKGVGTALVAFSEKWANARGFVGFVLHAREVSVPFYEKMGYKIVGERFEEVNIPHFKMEKHF